MHALQQMLSADYYVIYQTRKVVSDHLPNTNKRVEHTTCSGRFLTNVEVFVNVVKHYRE